MHIQSYFWSSTGANLFCGIRQLCIILPSALNSRNTLQVLLAVKHPVQNTSETEQLCSHPAVPGQITWTRSCLALHPRFFPLGIPQCWCGGGWCYVCAHTCMHMGWLHGGCVSNVRGQIKVFSCSVLWVPGGVPSLNSAKDLVWQSKLDWFCSWENVNDIFFNSSLQFTFTKLTCHSFMV